MTIYACPSCHEEQDDIWIREGRYLSRQNKGWKEWKCPSCLAELPADLLEEIKERIPFYVELDGYSLKGGYCRVRLKFVPNA